jgi:hypothetical protein
MKKGKYKRKMALEQSLCVLQQLNEAIEAGTIQLEFAHKHNIKLALLYVKDATSAGK